MNAFFLEEGGRLAYLAGLIVFSAFFSGSETALFSLSREELDHLVRRHPRRGGAARRLISQPDNCLVSVLFGNLLVNTLYFSSVAVMANNQLALRGGTFSAGLSIAALLVLIMFGEILPKGIAAASPRAISSVASLPLLGFYIVVGAPARRLASPVLKTVDWIAQRREVRCIEPDELRMLVELAGSSGALSGQEAEMIDGVVALSELRVREVMVPRVDVTFASVDDRPEQVLRRLKTEVRSRAPVYDGPSDNIVGVVETRKLVAATCQSQSLSDSLKPYVDPVVFVPESARVASVLEMVRDTNLEVAVAVDEYGGTAGLLTLDDLADAVFGEISDENGDGEPVVEETEPGSYILSGDHSVRDWAELFHVTPEEGQFDTLGGFVTHLLNRIPKPGDEVTWQNIKLVVLSMRRRRVTRVRLSLVHEKAAEQESCKEDES